MGYLLRVFTMLVLGCTCVVGAAVAIGSRSDTTLKVGLHENEGVTYVMYIEDMERGVQTWLAGDDCFAPLPPWVYDESHESGWIALDVGRSYSQVISPEQMRALLECRPWRYP